MVMLEGIIYKKEKYVVLRGFAPIGDLAEISRKSKSYQRNTDDQHKKDIVKYLSEAKSYLPEIILACKVNDYAGLIEDLWEKDALEKDSRKPLHISSKKLPTKNDTVRYACLEIELSDNEKLFRIDGNHRLEPFSDNDEWWSAVFDEYSNEECKDKQNKVNEFRKSMNNVVVSFSIIISDYKNGDKFEASIFNNINFKQLPLKQEKSLQNIYQFLKNSNELGDAHELTMKLIELTETDHFIGLPLFRRGQGQDEIYRTLCFKIVENLLMQKKNLNTDKEGIKSAVDKKRKDLDSLISKRSLLKNDANNKQKLGIKQKHMNNTKLKNNDDLDKAIRKLKLIVDNFENQIKSIENFCSNINSWKIEIAIQSLRPVYNKFGKDYGNISIFVALVYFKLLNEGKFTAFVDWIIKNGFNKIPINNCFPTHTAQSLILLFERAYEAKRREIFISMQFGDPQSEMIYEKIFQTIELFNKEKGLDIIVKTIRVDQKISSELFDIPQEISHAIENSALIIADLSSRNINVYHEVGIAMGLAQAKNIPAPIILIYKTNTVFRDNNQGVNEFVGFNIRAESQLRFQTNKELMDGLKERLEKYYEV